MRDLLVLIAHLITMVFRLARPVGLRAVIAESVLARHQLLILNRSRRRSPNLRIRDRLIAGFRSLWIKPSRFRRVAILFKSSTLFSFHRALVRRKYQLLFSPKRKTKPGPKGPEADVIRAVVEMKQRNPTWGAHGSPSNSIWPSGLLLIRMWFGGFWLCIISRRQMVAVRRG
jgi:putative transposase